MFGQASNKLNRLLSDTGLNVKGKVIEGEPHKVITSYSSEKDTDLIVIGARDISFIKGMLIGSVTDAVLKSSDCPILVIH